MSTLDDFAAHCRAMSTAEHISDDDRALFARLADEVDAYQDPHPSEVDAYQDPHPSLFDTEDA